MTTKPERSNIIRFKLSILKSGTQRHLKYKKIDCTSNGTGEIGCSGETRSPAISDEIKQLILKKNALDELNDESVKTKDSVQAKDKETILVKPCKPRKRSSSCLESISVNPYKRFNKGFEIEQKGKLVKVKTTTEQRPVKFSVKLSKKEIEEDFMAMVGHKPPRRPKKRTRTVQKTLDSLFPGLYLANVKAEDYKVSNEPKV